MNIHIELFNHVFQQVQYVLRKLQSISIHIVTSNSFYY